MKSKSFYKDENKLVWTLSLLTIVLAAAYVVFGIMGLIKGEHMYFICLSLWAVAGMLVIFIHGVPMVGLKNVIVIIFIGMAVSMFFECMGCNFGWFFSKYIYTEVIPGPKVFGFNLYSLIAYGIGIYLIYCVAQTAVHQYDNHYKKGDLILIPLIGGCLFAAVDFATDPLLATISKTHIWTEPGIYYGIPWQNYLGWYLMAYALINSDAVVENIHGEAFSVHEIYWGVFLVAIGMMVVPTLILYANTLNSDKLE